MSFKKARKILKRIDAIFKDINDKSKIDVLERDLLKYQVLKLYDTISMMQVDGIKVKPMPKDKKDKPLRIKDKRIQSGSKIPAPEKIEIEMEQQEVKPIEIIEESKPVLEEPAIDKPEPEEVIAKQLTIDPEIEDTLFFELDSNEISAKLAKRPIKDLTKEMGINEYIFTKDFLFDGDNSSFSHTLEELNNMSSFYDAKFLLAELAEKYNWLSSNKVRKAKNYIQFVKRRYY